MRTFGIAAFVAFMIDQIISYLKQQSNFSSYIFKFFDFFFCFFFYNEGCRTTKTKKFSSLFHFHFNYSFFRNFFMFKA